MACGSATAAISKIGLSRKSNKVYPCTPIPSSTHATASRLSYPTLLPPPAIDLFLRFNFDLSHRFRADITSTTSLALTFAGRAARRANP